MGRAIYFKPKLLILDEPTIGLSVKESQKVLDYVLQLKKARVPVAFISHNLYHVYSIADRLVVLRSGEKIAELKKEVSIDELTKMIIGR
jgi:simple sugar transport system ATP-binding protein